MSFKLDISKMKYVKSDKNSTTLQHPAGHLITLAHNVLAPENKMALASLTKAAKSSPEMAEGGKISDKERMQNVTQKQLDIAKKNHKEMSPEEKSKNDSYWNKANSELKSLPENMVRRKMAEGGDNTPKSPVPDSSGSSDGKKNMQDAKSGYDRSGGHIPPDSPLSTGDWSGLNPFSSKAKGGRIPMAKGGSMKAEMASLPDWFHEAGSHPVGTSEPSYHDENSARNHTVDAGLPCLNPHCKSHGQPHPNCKCYSGGGPGSEGFAKGGEVSKLRYCAHGKPHKEDCEYSQGISEQGKDVRYGNNSSNRDDKEQANHFAKEEAKGRAENERQIKPKMKGMAEGGMTMPSMYAEGEEVHKDEPRPIPGGGTMPTPADHYREAARLAEKAGDSSQSNSPPIISDFNNIGGQPQAQQPNQSQPPPDEAAPDQQDAQPQPAPAQAAPQQGAPNPNPRMLNVPQKVADTQIPQNSTQLQQPPVHPATAEALQENAAWEQDLNNGHITPKTYNDLMFYNKDGQEKTTLGKIGSIFGLMLSGAGSGLAHQPNMALHMMDNVIRNDLEAQKNSKDNARNYLKLNQERLLNDANVQNVLQSANYTAAQKASVLQDVAQKNYATQYMNMGSVAVYDQLQKLKKMQPGTQSYQQAAQTLMMMADAVHKNNGAMAATLGQAGSDAMGMYGMTTPGQGGTQQVAQDPEETFKNNMQMLEQTGQKDRADSLRRKHLRGAPGFANSDVTQEYKDRYTSRALLDDKLNDVMNYAQQHKGSINPSVIQLGAQKAAEAARYYNKSVDNLGLTPGRMGWIDEQIKKNPTSLWQQLIGNQERLKEIRDSNSHQRDIELNKLGFDVHPGPPGSAGTQMSKSGRPMQQNSAGKWEYKK